MKYLYICSREDFCGSVCVNYTIFQAKSISSKPSMKYSQNQTGFTHRIKETLNSKNNDPPVALLEVSTWSKDNEGLYDYQSTKMGLCQQRFVIDQNCKIYRDSSNGKVIVELEGKPEKLRLENIYVASICRDPQLNVFKVQSADVSGVQPHHFVIQEDPDLFRNSYVSVGEQYQDYSRGAIKGGYTLQLGNCIRLGKVELNIIEINDSFGCNIAKESSHLGHHKGVLFVKDEFTKGSCKFCLCEETSSKDPLISPCNCKGSCALVHMECLRSWIKSKVKKQVSDIAITYNFSQFQCEICKTLFPNVVRLQNREDVEMLAYQKSNKPYLIMETNPREGAGEKAIHVIFPNENQSVKIGRGHNCELRINDITVSRIHSEIRYKDGRFHITDQNSKFGTLVKFRNEFSLKSKLRLQSGRTTLSFSLLNGRNRSKGSMSNIRFE